MSYQRLAYDDQDTAGQMHADCDACASAMRLPARSIAAEVLGEAPSIEFDDFPREILKPEITISEATAHLAGRLHLHY